MFYKCVGVASKMRNLENITSAEISPTSKRSEGGGFNCDFQAVSISPASLKRGGETTSVSHAMKKNFYKRNFSCDRVITWLCPIRGGFFELAPHFIESFNRLRRQININIRDALRVWRYAYIPVASPDSDCRLNHAVSDIVGSNRFIAAHPDRHFFAAAHP